MFKILCIFRSYRFSFPFTHIIPLDLFKMKSVTIKDVVVCCMKPSCIVIFIVVWRWFVSGGAGSEDNGVVTRLTAVLLVLVGI